MPANVHNDELYRASRKREDLGMRRMCTVCEDIVDAILDSCDRWWPRDYARLALVSSAWLKPVRKRLYSQLFFNSARACGLLARSLEQNPSLIPLIHSLCLRPGADTQSGLSSELVDSSDVERLLAAVQVQSLTLCGFAAPCSIRFLRHVGSPRTIKELCIGYPLIGKYVLQEFEFCTLEWDSELFRRFTSLKKLSIDGYIRLNICASKKSISQDPTLEELSLLLVERAPSASFHDLLCSKDAWSKLRTLSITHDVFLYYRHDLLFTHSSIENLILTGDFESNRFAPLDDAFQGSLMPLQNIRRLKLQRYTLTVNLLSDIAEVFPCIEELDVGWLFHWMVPQQILTFFDGNGVGDTCLRKLQRLVWNKSIRPVHDEGPQAKNGYLDSLARICAAHKIGLDFDDTQYCGLRTIR